MGIPIVLSGDDPALFGYDEVTVDWYEAYMAWGLNLGDLKKLALNSLTPQWDDRRGKERCN